MSNREDAKRPDHEYRRDLTAGWLDTPAAHAAYGITNMATLYAEVPSRLYRVARTGPGCSRRRLFAPVGWAAEATDQSRHPDDLVPLRDAATMTERSTRTLRRWVSDGKLTRYEGQAPDNGGSPPVLVSASALLHLVESSEPEAPTMPEDAVKNLRAEAARLTAKADAIEAAIALLAEVMS